MKTCTVGTHKKCVSMTSGDFRIAVTTQVGPRIIGAWVGKSDNMLAVLKPEPMQSVDTGFILYGGHRLWTSPEAAPRSYTADNDPVIVTEIDGGFEFGNKPDATTGIQKTMIIEAIDEGFRITHRIANTGLWPITLAPWALTAMAPGGMTIIPQYRDEEANPYAPDRRLILWPYSSYNDKRIVYGDNYICLKHDAAQKPTKIGFNADEGWIGYVNNGTALIKYFEVNDPDQTEYPDFGCNVESWTGKEFTEIETLAPLYELHPDEECEHVEFWQGIGGLPEIKNEKDIKKHIEPKLI